MAEREGIDPIDRRDFKDLQFVAADYKQDFKYRRKYLEAERRFLGRVHDMTSGYGVSIFLDNIGGPVYRATLKALARQGVISTVGWKKGMVLNYNRGEECIARHTHVHTHGARQSDAPFLYSLKEDWLPPTTDSYYSWEDVNQLADDYRNARLTSYFPVYQVNSL
jgi:NADPH:quinone reductase-like Zn-dependent oxidoreductase